MNAELKSYLQMRADQRIAELDLQERAEINRSNVNRAIECSKKKCDLYDLKSVVLNFKTKH